jgi:predicted anti-sigma-YlaC factor YlaD
MAPAALDEHLGHCPACARWVAGMQALAGQTRISRVPVPDLSAAILAGVALPAARLRRQRRWLQAALVVVSLAQLAIAAPALFGDSMAMSVSMHAAHESAAWNAAVGLALLAVAVRPQRAAGLLPMLLCFVLLLGVLSARDLAAGAVTVSRLTTHLGCVLGLALLAALARQQAREDDGPVLTVAQPPETDGGPVLRGVA